MGTRSHTRFVKADGTPIALMYRQFDGYPDVHGKELENMVGHLELVNGMGFDQKDIANSMGCLAAMVVSVFKDEPGGIYLKPVTDDDTGIDYIYTLSPEKNDSEGIGVGRVFVRVTHGGEDDKPLYDGPLTGMVAAIEAKEEEDN